MSRQTPDLEGRVVVVTGSTRGIGRAIAESCAALGATVVVNGRSAEAVARTVSELIRVAADTAPQAGVPGAAAPVSGIAADVSDPTEVRRVFDHALETWGRIDIWVNNAGISQGYRPFDELPAEDIAAIVDTNLTGTMYGSSLALRHFREHGGVLLNMLGRGFRGDATPHTAAYASTKAALASLTRSLAEENRDRPDVHVHSLVPGMVPTDFYRNVVTSPRLEATRGNVDLALHAFGVPLDVVGAGTAAFLAGDAWRSTGRNLNLLSGTRTARGVVLMAWYGMSGRMKRDH